MFVRKARIATDEVFQNQNVKCYAALCAFSYLQCSIWKHICFFSFPYLPSKRHTQEHIRQQAGFSNELTAKVTLANFENASFASLLKPAHKHLFSFLLEMRTGVHAAFSL